MDYTEVVVPNTIYNFVFEKILIRSHLMSQIYMCFMFKYFFIVVGLRVSGAEGQELVDLRLVTTDSSISSACSLSLSHSPHHILSKKWHGNNVRFDVDMHKHDRT
jgi:hypothetical protein